MSTGSVDDFKLIELVRQNHHLYDKNDADYRDILKKTITWKAIAVALGAPGELCRKRFRCLRDRFNKERKIRKDKMLTDSTLPPIYKKMLFLWDHLTHRRSSIPAKIPIAEAAANDSRNADIVREEIDKQIQILKKGGELPSEAECSSNDDSACDLKNEIVFILDNSSNISHETNSEQQEVIACNYVDEKSSSNQPAQIIFLKSKTEKSPENETSSEQLKENVPVCAIKSSSQEVSANGQPDETHHQNEESKEVLESSCSSSEKRKRVPVFKKAKRVLGGNPCEKPKKKVKISDNTSQQTKRFRPKRRIIRTVKPSCNDSFSVLVKHYLDKISSPERLSSARLQILTVLHNEVYSTYT